MLQFSLRNIPGRGKSYKWIGCHNFKLAPLSTSFLLKDKSGTLQEEAGLEKWFCLIIICFSRLFPMGDHPLGYSAVSQLNAFPPHGDSG